MGSGVWGLGSGVWGLGSGVWGLRSEVSGLRSQVSGPRSQIRGPKFLAQHFPHLARQILQRERLLQESRAALDCTFAEDCVLGIAGEIKDLGFGARVGHVLDQ